MATRLAACLINQFDAENLVRVASHVVVTARLRPSRIAHAGTGKTRRTLLAAHLRLCGVHQLRQVETNVRSLTIGRRKRPFSFARQRHIEPRPAFVLVVLAFEVRVTAHHVVVPVAGYEH